MRNRCHAISFFVGLIVLILASSDATAAQKKLAAGSVPDVVKRAKLAPLKRLAATNEMQLALALPLRDAVGLTNLLRELYDPASPNFRQWLTPAEFAARFSPSQDDYAQVMAFAKRNGLKITSTHSNRLVLGVKGKVSNVERTFQVRLNAFRHPKEARNFFAPDAEPVVDSKVPIFHISGLDDFSLPRPSALLKPTAVSTSLTPRAGSGPGGTFAGNDFRKAYAKDTPLTGAGQNVALVQYDGFYPVDITNYVNYIGLSNVPPLIVVDVNGGVPTPGGGSIEVALDIQMVIAMAPGVSNIYVYEAPNPSPWVDMLGQIADDNFAKQVSCSWGGGGPNAAAEQIFLQMAAQGQSFFNASGDNTAFDGAIPFPSESPNITQVGGTTLTTDGSGDYVSETTWNWGGGQGSSGGISTVVPIPSWQLGLDMTTNQGSFTMRNVPDVALTADDIFIFYDNGTNGSVGGTSAAAPLWAGFMALVNEQAEQLAQPSVGFLNPALSALCRGTNYAVTFNDISTGNNTNYDSPNLFYAVPGFDLCTGWGTPTGTNLVNALTTADDLRLLPPTTFATHGIAGGPFAQTNWIMTLTNAGVASLDWSVGETSPWLEFSATGGSLAANTTTNITLQLVQPESLTLGIHFAVVLVTNLSQSRVQVVTAQVSISQNIVQNGSFETGDFTSWTLVGDTVISNNVYNIVTTDNVFPGVVHEGNFGAFLGQGGYLATLTQDLPTFSNQLYQLSFWLNNPVADSPQEFAAYWNGTNLVDLVDPPALVWTNFQFLVTATGTNTQLQFTERNDPNFFGFDEVTVTPVPPVVFQSAALNGGNLEMGWVSLPGLKYEIQITTNLAPADWQPLANVTATTNTASFTEMNLIESSDAQRFYRLVLVP